jgi:peptide/nickel transport system ATP-binding protein
LNKSRFTAVDDVSFTIEKGRTLGLIGESGCGKSTVSRLLLKLIPADEGRIIFDDKEITHYSFSEMLPIRRQMQFMFQHPDSALNPRKSIEESLLEANRLHRAFSPNKAREKMAHLLETTGLHTEILRRYPHQISGGQIQRVALTRALMLDPKVLILDEPTSMLDVSVQAQVLQLLKKIQQQYNLTYLFISHDLDLVRWMCHHIAIMQKGQIVEIGETERVYMKPQHVYTKQLIKAFANM